MRLSTADEIQPSQIAAKLGLSAISVYTPY
jgi:hypothetical protein